MKEVIMKSRTVCLSIVLCLSFIFPYFLPIVNASEMECSGNGDVVTYENYAVYYENCSNYNYCIFLNTNTGSDSFAVVFSKQPDSVYEYYMEVDPGVINVNSTAFWAPLVSECFESSSQWNAVYYPDAVTTVQDYDTTLSLAASDPHEAELTAWLENRYGSKHTGTIIATGYRASTIMFLYEDLYYGASKRNNYAVAQVISVAAFIVGVLGHTVTSALLSVLSYVIAGDSIPSGSIISEYSVDARWFRYVRRKDSDYNLNISELYVSFTAYANANTGRCAVDESSELRNYLPTEEHFNDYEAQFTAAYNYYLNS